MENAKPDSKIKILDRTVYLEGKETRVSFFDSGGLSVAMIEMF